MLTDDTFNHGQFIFTHIIYRPSDPTTMQPSLSVIVVPELTSGAKQLALVIDGKSFAFAGADIKRDDGLDSTRIWDNPGISWSSGQTVSLSLEPTQTLTIEALNDDIPHGLGDAGAAGVAEFRVKRNYVPERETHDMSLAFNTLLEESGDTGGTAFEPGYATKLLKHLALDGDDQGDPICTITHVLQPGHGYVVGSPSEATVNVTGTGCTSNNEVEDPLTASFEDSPASHDGETPFSFQIAFSAAITASAADLRDHALTVTGGAVTDAASVDGRDDLWTVTVTPSGTGVVSIRLNPVGDCGEAGAICTENGTPLTTALAQLIPYAPLAEQSDTLEASDALTANFTDVPTEHDGSAGFTFRIEFSESVRTGYATLRDEALSAAGGTVKKAKRVEGRSDLVRQANWQKVEGASPLERRSNRTTFLREPCVGSREGAGEASVAAWMGRAIEHRKSDGPGCRGFQIGRRQHRRHRFGEMSASHAVSENPCTFARLLLGPWEVFKLPRLS